MASGLIHWRRSLAVSESCAELSRLSGRKFLRFPLEFASEGLAVWVMIEKVSDEYCSLNTQKGLLFLKVGRSPRHDFEDMTTPHVGNVQSGLSSLGPMFARRLGPVDQTILLDLERRLAVQRLRHG
jgi:hypothetical protein